MKRRGRNAAPPHASGDWDARDDLLLVVRRVLAGVVVRRDRRCIEVAFVGIDPEVVADESRAAADAGETLQFVNTGIASTSARSVTVPVFQRMRIKVVPNLITGDATAYYYINDANVATITVTGATLHNGFVPTVSIGKTTGGFASRFVDWKCSHWRDAVARLPQRVKRFA